MRPDCTYYLDGEKLDYQGFLDRLASSPELVEKYVKPLMRNTPARVEFEEGAAEAPGTLRGNRQTSRLLGMLNVAIGGGYGDISGLNMPAGNLGIMAAEARRMLAKGKLPISASGKMRMNPGDWVSYSDASRRMQRGRFVELKGGAMILKPESGGEPIRVPLRKIDLKSLPRQPLSAKDAQGLRQILPVLTQAAATGKEMNYADTEFNLAHEEFHTAQRKFGEKGTIRNHADTDVLFFGEDSQLAQQAADHLIDVMGYVKPDKTSLEEHLHEIAGEIGANLYAGLKTGDLAEAAEVLGVGVDELPALHKLYQKALVAANDEQALYQNPATQTILEPSHAGFEHHQPVSPQSGSGHEAVPPTADQGPSEPSAALQPLGDGGRDRLPVQAVDEPLVGGSLGEGHRGGNPPVRGDRPVVQGDREGVAVSPHQPGAAESGGTLGRGGVEGVPGQATPEGTARDLGHGSGTPGTGSSSREIAPRGPASSRSEVAPTLSNGNLPRESVMQGQALFAKGKKLSGPGSQPALTLEFTPGKRGMESVLRGDPVVTEMMGELYGSTINGVHLTPEGVAYHVKKLTQTLSRSEMTGQRRKDFQSLLHVLKQADEAGGGLAYADTGDSASMSEEQFHAAQLRLGQLRGGGYAEHVDPELAAHALETDEWKIARAYLTDPENYEGEAYPDDPGVLVSEIGARLDASRFDELGLSEEQGKRAQATYDEIVLASHPYSAIAKDPVFGGIIRRQTNAQRTGKGEDVSQPGANNREPHEGAELRRGSGPSGRSDAEQLRGIEQDTRRRMGVSQHVPPAHSGGAGELREADGRTSGATSSRSEVAPTLSNGNLPSSSAPNILAPERENATGTSSTKAGAKELSQQLSARNSPSDEPGSLQGRGGLPDHSVEHRGGNIDEGGNGVPAEISASRSGRLAGNSHLVGDPTIKGRRPLLLNSAGGQSLASRRPNLGFKKFLEKDLLPGAKSVSRATITALDEVQKLLAPQTRGPAAQRGAGLVRQIGSVLAQRRDQALTALEEFRQYFGKVGPDRSFDVIDAIETGNMATLSPVESRFVATMRGLFAQREAEIKTLGLLDSFKENYFPHLWKDPEAAEHWVNNWQGKRPMAGPESYRKKRTIPTIREGMNDPDFHLVPAFENPVEFVLAKLAEEDKSITAHLAQRELKAQGDLQLVRPGEKPPAGWASINDRIFTVRGPRTGAVSLPAGANIEPDEVKVFGSRELGKYYAPEPLALVVNHALTPGIQGSALVQAWGTVNRTLNMLQLGGSAFHGLTTTLNSSFSDIALGLEQVAAGMPVKAARSVLRGMTPFASAVQDVFRGTAIQKHWDGAPAPDPMTAAVVEALKAAGGQARQDPYWTTSYTDQIRDAWRESNYPGVALRLPFVALEATLKPIMEYMVPRAKLSAFAKLAEMEIRRRPIMTRHEARETFGKIWDSVDNRFGQLSQRNLLMQPTLKDVMNMTVGRPGWNIGTMRELGGGIYDLGKMAKDIVSGRSPKMSHRTAYVAAMLIGALVLGGLLNRILTGENPEGYRDLIAPRDGGTDDDGNPTRFILPTYLAKDVYSYITNPLGTLKAKMAPAVGIIGDIATNRDYQGEKIYGEGGAGFWKYAFQQALPYSVLGLLKSIDDQASPAKRVLPFFGVTPAPKRMGMTAAQRKMADYEHEHAPATRLESERSTTKSKISAALRSGNEDRALLLANAAIDAGVISHNDALEAETYAKLPKDVARFKAMPLEAEVGVLAVATPKERLTFLPAFGSKVAGKSFDDLPALAQAKVIEKTKALKLTPAEMAVADGAPKEQ